MKNTIRGKGKEKRTGVRLLSIAAWISLLGAFVFGRITMKEDVVSLAASQLEESNLALHQKSPDLLKVVSLEDGSESSIKFGSAQGYGGELTVGVLYDQLGSLQEVLILRDRETPSFLVKLTKKGYFSQFPGKVVDDRFQLEEDLDGVSGCTVSALAFASAIRKASYQAANTDFGLDVREPVIPWNIGVGEYLVMLIAITGILSLYMKKRWLRYASLLLSLGVIGFYLNASLSITHFARLLLGFLPGIKEHTTWWFLVALALIFPLFLRKNLYCYALCPFHAVEIILIRISGFKVKLTRGFQRATKVIVPGLLWLALMVIFISGNPTLGSYEPFALIFSLDGVGLQWYLLPAALIGAMLVPDYYCRFFCPVGRILNMVLKAGSRLNTLKTGRNNGRSIQLSGSKILRETG